LITDFLNGTSSFANVHRTIQTQPIFLSKKEYTMELKIEPESYIIFFVGYTKGKTMLKDMLTIASKVIRGE